MKLVLVCQIMKTLTALMVNSWQKHGCNGDATFLVTSLGLLLLGNGFESQPVTEWISSNVGQTAR